MRRLWEKYWFYVPLLLAILFYATAAWFYMDTFGAHRTADQEKWGQFGDFIGGIVNPALGLVTIMLLLASLGLQRQELKLTREEMAKSSKALDEQVKQFERKSLKDDLYARADQVYQEITSVLETKNQLQVGRPGTSGAGTVEIPSVKEMMSLNSSEEQIETNPHMRVAFLRLRDLLPELAYYLELIDNLSPEKSKTTSTDYYRRRVQLVCGRAVATGFIEKATRRKLKPTTPIDSNS